MELRQIEFGARSSFLHLHGKGAKGAERSLEDARDSWLSTLLFAVYPDEKLTRDGVDTILKNLAARGRHLSCL
ncbi:hypothetical protein WS98_00020 [Burkholderia territorii]|uniref:hypothetical protein n=1 Tax=Burkholderia territorii TaxID=1503055 RepID=UPI00075A9D9C|nr:hypothetical protein [Burkholderia territorii]KVL40558.1 hypothetical protein WS98_00020 [Burkholderia territorii]